MENKLLLTNWKKIPKKWKLFEEHVGYDDHKFLLVDYYPSVRCPVARLSISWRTKADNSWRPYLFLRSGGTRPWPIDQLTGSVTPPSLQPQPTHTCEQGAHISQSNCAALRYTTLQSSMPSGGPIRLGEGGGGADTEGRGGGVFTKVPDGYIQPNANILGWPAPFGIEKGEGQL